MKEIDLDSALDQLIEGGEKTAFERFAIERSSCPSPARFYVAFPHGWTPAEAAHIETCPYCEKSQAYIRSLLASPRQMVVAAARLAWNGLRERLEVTVDEVRDLVSADSPFGGGFQVAHAGGTMGVDDDEEPVAYASTREGDELTVGVKGGRVTARFDGGSPPRLKLEGGGSTQSPSEPREFAWKDAERGWQADLGEANKLNGVLIVELEPQD